MGVDRTLRRYRGIDAIDPTETFAVEFAVMHNAVFASRCGTVQFSD
jgi:hypothetical protein